MKKGILEFWVGLFVLLGLLALAVLSFRVAGGQGGLGGERKTYTVFAQFSDIGGLKVQAPVKAAGVLVGRVGAIELDPQTYYAKVRLDLDGRYAFSTDVAAQILTSGLLGEQYIGLEQGADENNLTDGGQISDTSSALVLEKLIGQFAAAFIEKGAQTPAKEDSAADEAAQ